MTKISRRAMLRTTAGLTAGAVAATTLRLEAQETTAAPGAVVDHVQIGCVNAYTTAFELMNVTKLGHYDGGFGDTVTVGYKFVPLGDSYLEIASLVDAFATAEPATRLWWHRRAVAKQSSILSGVSLRVSTMAELNEIAKRHGGGVRKIPTTRTPPDGPPVSFWEAPYASATTDPWQAGKPTWCCWENRLYRHPSGQPVVNAPGLIQPIGIAWLEMGGTKAQMQQWLGQNPDDLRMNFNGKAAGLHALSIKTDVGDIVIRRPPATGA